MRIASTIFICGSFGSAIVMMVADRKLRRYRKPLPEHRFNRVPGRWNDDSLYVEGGERHRLSILRAQRFMYGLFFGGVLLFAVGL